jgi:hypothetical protein
MRIIVFWIIVCSSLNSLAQEIQDFKLPEKDSILIELERQMQYNQLLKGYIDPNVFLESFQLPKYDLNDALLLRWNTNINGIVPNQMALNTSSMESNGFIPFLRNGQVLSSANYKIGDRFSFGGFSYGANSIFSSPSLNPEINRFDMHGSTLFIQYKVSKNFKIETRVNVIKGPAPVF